ncbi:MAG: serine hydrolase [Gemmatimonadales bacterium]
MTKRTAYLALGLAALAAPATAQRRADPLAGLDAWIDQVRTEFHIVGMAVGIVYHDSLVYARGFGLREDGKPAPVTPNTVFAIGSNTKSFTTTAAAMLADDGKIRWNDKVTRWLPDFELFDPYVTREINLRDVMSHRSGLGRRGDALWYGTKYSRAEILHRIRFLEPNAGFRTEMGYQNIMFLAAGEAIGAAAGIGYDELIRTRILGPLGMTSSSMSITDLSRQPDVSQPHNLADGKASVIPWRNIDNIGPAGSINSNIIDMAAYLRFHLGNGTYRGTKLVSAANLGVTKTPHINVGGVGDSLTHFQAYGLGWVLQDYRGRRIAWHNGGIDGMLSEMWTVPEEGLGIVVLTNTAPHSAGPIVVRNIIDRYLIGKPAKDYLAEGLAAARRMETAQAAQVKQREAARLTDTKPSVELSKYAATYVDSLYGAIEIRTGGAGLEIGWQGNWAPLHHWHLDQFRGEILPGQDVMVSFRIDPSGKVTEAELESLGTFKRR